MFIAFWPKFFPAPVEDRLVCLKPLSIWGKLATSRNYLARVKGSMQTIIPRLDFYLSC
jgi:hypothetical protein